MPDIWFPYLGIEISHLNKTAFSIFGFDIAWYGIIIAIGVVAGLLLARYLAKKSGQDPELYLDFLIYALIFAIIGARLYYVTFSWDQYKNDWTEIFNLRNGGLAIYGGVIGAVLTAIIYCKIKRYSLLELMDTAMPGLILGQAIGRWGNFFNQEAFGGYTDNIFAMRLNVETAAYTTTELMKHTVTVGGVRYIQVHPTFLYESLWCLLILVIMLIIFKHRKFKGQVAFTYLIGYGLGRMFIESLRTDQLLLWNTNIPASVVFSAFLVLLGVILMIVFGVRYRIEKQKIAMAADKYAPEIQEESELFDDLLNEDSLSTEEAEAPSEATNEAAASDTASENAAASKMAAADTKEEELKDEDLWD